MTPAHGERESAEPPLQLARLSDGTYVDLTYSAIDGGWYAQRHDDNRVTQCFDSIKALRSALTEGTVEFTD